MYAFLLLVWQYGQMVFNHIWYMDLNEFLLYLKVIAVFGLLILTTVGGFALIFRALFDGFRPRSKTKP